MVTQGVCKDEPAEVIQLSMVSSSPEVPRPQRASKECYAEKEPSYLEYCTVQSVFQQEYVSNTIITTTCNSPNTSISLVSYLLCFSGLRLGNNSQALRSLDCCWSATSSILHTTPHPCSCLNGKIQRPCPFLPSVQRHPATNRGRS